MECETRQPAQGPAVTLSEKFRGRSWLIGVREEQGELVVATRRWSAVILMEIPEIWEGMPVRILRQSQGKPGQAHTREQGRAGRPNK